MKTLPSKSVDIILTDPPYYIPAQSYETRTQFRRNIADLGMLDYFYRDVFVEIDRVLKDDGFMYMFCDGQSYPLMWYHSYPMFKNVRPLIWDKKNAINGYYWRHQHELIVFGVRKDAQPIPTGDGDIIGLSPVNVNERAHPAEKPSTLAKILLEKHQNNAANKTVLDCFCGSGALLVGAKELGFTPLGIELNIDYADIAEKSLSQIKIQPTIQWFQSHKL